MIHEKHRIWLTGRMIDPDLCEKLGLETKHEHEGYWLSLPYLLGGEVVNHKHRLTSEKRHRMDPGAPLTLWNVDVLSHPSVLAGAPVIITEGEWDALAAMTAGLEFVVSVPNGAPSQATDDPLNAKRYEWVHKHRDQLMRVKQFILATDGDAAGQNLAHDLAALLGPERCRFVTYPEGCKDLNDIAIMHGHPTLVANVNDARPYPIKGIFGMDDFPERGEVKSWPVGIDALRDSIAIVPGTLTVVTGYANMGKSTLLNAIVGDMVASNVPVVIASFETDVKPILRDNLRAAILKKPIHEARANPAHADALIKDNVRIISQSVDDDDAMDIDYFLDLCRVSVVRDGTKFVLLDPWNEIEHKRRRDETETDYVSRALRAIKRFAKVHDVAFWIVAHPSKPDDQARNKPPGLYSISGSANWANKADYGLTYHRPDPQENLADVIVTKVRMGLPGKRGKTRLTFDHRTSEFVEVLDHAA